MANKHSSKKIIRTVSEIAVLIGLIGIVGSFMTAKMQSEKLNDKIADYQQKQGNLDRFLAGKVGFSEFVHEFDDRDVQSILNKEGQNFVVQQWALTISVILTFAGSVVLAWFVLGWFIKTFSASGIYRHFMSFWLSLPLISRFYKKRSKRLCWTSSDLLLRNNSGTIRRQSSGTINGADPVQSLNDVAKDLRKDQSQSRQSGSQAGLKVKQQLTTEDLPSPVIEEPIRVLKDLSEHVSAIREYATLQQGRMEKLQDGYDWNIIRNFCLRIIRCIDNLDTRINELSEKEANVSNLEEVRDELIFALESSGIESFKPQINADYSNQEKILEAVKDKVPTDEADKHGKVAEIIRCGYQYRIEDDTVKVIRPCQVVLYA